MLFTSSTNFVILLKPAFLKRTPFPPSLLTLCRMGFALLLLLGLFFCRFWACPVLQLAEGRDQICFIAARELMVTMQGPETVLCHPPRWQCHSEGQKWYAVGLLFGIFLSFFETFGFSFYNWPKKRKSNFNHTRPALSALVAAYELTSVCGMSPCVVWSSLEKHL